MALRKTGLREIRKCLECGGSDLIEDHARGEIFCQNCGLVTKDSVMDKGPEWRAFTNDERKDRERTGGPVSFSRDDKGLSTIIYHINRDAHGRKLPISKRLTMLRLRKLQLRTLFGMDKNLTKAMLELDRISDKLHIPFQVKESAAVIYRRAIDRGLVRGRSISAAVAAVIYAACRVAKIPRSLREVVAVSNVKKETEVARFYRCLLKELGIRTPVDDPLMYVSKIASKVKIPIKTQRIAVGIINRAKKKGLVAGKNRMAIAATALYIACAIDNVRKTQLEIAEVAGVTPVTLRNRYKSLKETLKLNI